MQIVLAIGEGLCLLPIILILIILISSFYQTERAKFKSKMWKKAKKDKIWLKGATKQGGNKCPECGYKTLFWHPRPRFFYEKKSDGFYKEVDEYCPNCEIEKKKRYEVSASKIVNMFGEEEHFSCGKYECGDHGKGAPSVCWEEVTIHKRKGTKSMGIKGPSEIKRTTSIEDHCMLCEYGIRVR